MNISGFVAPVDPKIPRPANGRKHPAHQSLVERFNEPVIVFVTVCTQSRRRLLANSDVLRLLQDIWSATGHWNVGRFMIMTDHVHLFCTPNNDTTHSLTKWVRYWKSIASRQWPRPSEHPVWQVDFWDTQLRSVEHYDEKWDYVRMNPVRADLVVTPDAWPYQGELNEIRW